MTEDEIIMLPVVRRRVVEETVLTAHELVPVGPRGARAGMGCHLTKHSDEVVAEARRLVASGTSTRGAARVLELHPSTVQQWITRGCRKPPERFVLRPVKGKQ